MMLSVYCHLDMYTGFILFTDFLDCLLCMNTLPTVTYGHLQSHTVTYTHLQSPKATNLQLFPTVENVQSLFCIVTE